MQRPGKFGERGGIFYGEEAVAKGVAVEGLAAPCAMRGHRLTGGKVLRGISADHSDSKGEEQARKIEQIFSLA